MSAIVQEAGSHGRSMMPELIHQSEARLLGCSASCSAFFVLGGALSYRSLRRISRDGVGEQEVHPSTKLLVAGLVVRVYARLLLPPFFNAPLSRTQAAAPPITDCQVPSIKLGAGVTMEFVVVESNVPTQLTLMCLILCFSAPAFLREVAQSTHLLQSGGIQFR